MSEAYEMLKEWHTAFGVPVRSEVGAPDEKRRCLRVELIREEFSEFVKASGFVWSDECDGVRLIPAGETDPIEAADALADLLYVIYGAALEWGIPIDAVFAEVHRSNMSKMWNGPDGPYVKYRDDGKVIKPPTYSKADVAGVLARSGK